MSLFSWFKSVETETVDTIVSEFHAIKDRLAALATSKKAEADTHLQTAKEAQANATAAQAEADRATSVANKISALVA